MVLGLVGDVLSQSITGDTGDEDGHQKQRNDGRQEQIPRRFAPQNDNFIGDEFIAGDIVEDNSLGDGFI